MSWSDDAPAGCDLYYDPVIDEHVAHSPFGVIIPSWHLAPQQHEMAETGWNLVAAFTGAAGDGEIQGLDNEQLALSLVQLAGEFADPGLKARIWEQADEHLEPQWNRDAGEFTLGFGLDEPHPRGQLNARAMAGWVCTPGAWSRVFNEPNVAKHHEPTVIGVDFPRVALSEARWDGSSLRLAAHPRSATERDRRTSLRVTNVDVTLSWTHTRSDGTSEPIVVDGDELVVELIPDGTTSEIAPR